MRFRYFYQQLFSSFIIIAILLLAISFSAMQLTRNTIYESTNDMLSGATDFVTSREEITADYLNDISSQLDHWRVTVAYVDENNHYVFPYNKEKQTDQQLSHEELKALKAGKTLNLHPYNFQADKDNEDESLTIITPLAHAKEHSYAGYLVIGIPTQNVNHQISEMNHAILFSGVLAGTLAIGFSFLIARYQTRRITRFPEGTKEILAGHYDYRVENNHIDEFDDLAKDFNQMAQSIEDSWQEVDRQYQLRDQLLMDVAHEMRTPLTTMNGLLEGLQYHVIPENKVDRSLELLHNETQRLIRLVNSNLDYEKLKSHEMTLNLMTFSLTPLLNDLLLQLHDFAAEKGDRLSLKAADDIQIYADNDRFRQIVFNITQNAIQFTTGGTVTIRAWEDGVKTIITITDDGIGMTKEQLENIWERFYKADESRKSNKYGESGLGLAIVKQLVHAHHADVEVKSALGEGTQFTLTFPRVKPDSEAPYPSNDSTNDYLNQQSTKDNGEGLSS
ncbi:MAG: HAMP domain-containing sensor histidine kinase [Aerococcus sp.]|nr:HAMP domain-containing sensor histidine kinase [Aerococcus sp.]